MSNTEVKVPRVVIEQMVKEKIMHWVNASEYEVSGLGKVVVDGDIIRVIDAILLPQKNTRTATDIEPQDVGKAMFLLKDTPGELRFWWHSHVNMSVFWSGTDMDTIRSLAAPGWFVNTVFNKKWETRTAICMGQPFGLLIDNLPLEEWRASPTEEMIKSWDEEYNTNVTNVTRVYSPPKTGEISSGGKVYRFNERGEMEEVKDWGKPQGRLSKKQLKRLLKMQRTGKESGGASEDTALITMGTTSDDGPDPELPLGEDNPKRPQKCLICEEYPVTCICPAEAKLRAINYDNVGLCWCCEMDYGKCECESADLRMTKHSFIVETRRVGSKEVIGWNGGVM
jgi:hypothetical protein